MSLELCVLASGSSGNCTAVRTPAGVMLIDIGIGPRIAAQRLTGTGIHVNDVSAVCLTHFDSDHLNANWFPTLLRNHVRIHCTARRVDELVRIVADERVRNLIVSFDTNSFAALPGVTLRPISLAHDAEGSHGFVIEGFGGRVGYATDLGRVPNHLVEAFDNVDVLAIESNYDPDMQRTSGRPWFLVNRIMGGRGHLSNAQALDAVKRIFTRSLAQRRVLPAHVVLLHRSRECNCPHLLRRVFESDFRIASRLTLAEQYSPTPWLRAGTNALPPLVGQQLELAWG